MRKTIFTAEYTKLRQRLTMARRTTGMSQAALAIRLLRPQSFVSKYERGERRLDVVEYVAISVALGLNPCDLIREIMANTRIEDLTDQRKSEICRANKGKGVT